MWVFGQRNSDKLLIIMVHRGVEPLGEHHLHGVGGAFEGGSEDFSVAGAHFFEDKIHDISQVLVVRFHADSEAGVVE